MKSEKVFKKNFKKISEKKHVNLLIGKKNEPRNLRPYPLQKLYLKINIPTNNFLGDFWEDKDDDLQQKLRRKISKSPSKIFRIFLAFFLVRGTHQQNV